MKTLTYKLLGIGKIPESLWSEVRNERPIASDEGVRSTVTYRNFRAPGRYSNWKRQWLTASFVLTDKRLVLLKYSTPVVNLPATDERFDRLSASAEADDALLLAFDASLFLENSSGEIEWRFRTAQARLVVEAMRKKTS